MLLTLSLMEELLSFSFFLIINKVSLALSAISSSPIIALKISSSIFLKGTIPAIISSKTL